MVDAPSEYIVKPFNEERMGAFGINLEKLIEFISNQKKRVFKFQDT
ncbi:MAG: hypothetical protein GW914_03220 [Candidatus Aenigmarchaeota archaeon]|nr:hypothetical protein [Candidatus Aenigmarchaeota archaeon]